MVEKGQKEYEQNLQKQKERQQTIIQKGKIQHSNYKKQQYVKYQSAKVQVAVNVENESGNVFVLQKIKRKNSEINLISPSKFIKLLDDADASKKVQDIIGLELQDTIENCNTIHRSNKSFKSEETVIEKEYKQFFSFN